MENMTHASTRFGLDLLRAVCANSPDDNGFISPFSISVALSMTQLGAVGETSHGMVKALCWENGKEKVIHEENQKYIAMLQKGHEEYVLALANRIFVEAGYTLLPEFLQNTKKLYLAEAVPAQFKAQSEQERLSINKWVSDQTRERIQDLLTPGIVDKDTRMVLVNAIYFKGKWRRPFKADDTHPHPFKVSAVTTKEVPTMTSEKAFSFSLDTAGSHGFSALELPYKGEELSMVILLPTADFGLAEMEKGLSLEKLTSVFSRLGRPEAIKLKLPKFEVTCNYQLKEPLSQMGMGSAFSHQLADFSRMTSANDLVVSEVVHKAFVKVDEEGSEAAAATAVVMMMRCAMMMPMELPEFTIDHPFFFVIRDKRASASNSILFMGRVVDPTK